MADKVFIDLTGLNLRGIKAKNKRNRSYYTQNTFKMYPKIPDNYSWRRKGLDSYNIKSLSYDNAKILIKIIKEFIEENGQDETKTLHVETMKYMKEGLIRKNEFMKLDRKRYNESREAFIKKFKDEKSFPHLNLAVSIKKVK